MKLLCNAITTGAHVLKGKVFENRMIDVRVSNNKVSERRRKRRRTNEMSVSNNTTA